MLIADTNETECLVWSGATTNTGYGRCKRDGRGWLAHRWSWTQANGPIPPGSEIHHECENKLCYNPMHLACVNATEHRRSHGARGICAVYRDSERCVNGHTFDGAAIDSQGRQRRTCSTCRRTNRRRYDDKRKGITC